VLIDQGNTYKATARNTLGTRRRQPRKRLAIRQQGRHLVSLTDAVEDIRFLLSGFSPLQY
jgi:hypothetical protein